MTQSYTKTAIALHWLIAFGIFAALALGITMVNLPLSPFKLKLYSWHKWLGVCIFAFAVIRLAWRLTHPVPALPETMQVWERWAAHLTHGVLYVLMFAIPLSGWLMSSAAGFPVVLFGVLPLPNLIEKSPELTEIFKVLHFALNVGLVILVCMHVGAALKHHFINRDQVLTHMLPFLRRENS